MNKISDMKNKISDFAFILFFLIVFCGGNTTPETEAVTEIPVAVVEGTQAVEAEAEITDIDEESIEKYKQSWVSNLVSSSALTEDDTDKQYFKNKIDYLVKEIDYCIDRISI